MILIITFLNNPFEIIVHAVNELYPGIDVEIQFDPDLKFKKFLWFKFGHCGETIFPYDKSTPLVNISTNILFENVPEILAHELAHVVAGIKHEHNEVWDDIFTEIHKRFTEIIEEKYKKEGE